MHRCVLLHDGAPCFSQMDLELAAIFLIQLPFDQAALFQRAQVVADRVLGDLLRPAQVCGVDRALAQLLLYPQP